MEFCKQEGLVLLADEVGGFLSTSTDMCVYIIYIYIYIYFFFSNSNLKLRLDNSKFVSFLFQFVKYPCLLI